MNKLILKTMKYSEFKEAWESLQYETQAEIYIDFQKAKVKADSCRWHELNEDFFKRFFNSFVDVINAWENGNAYIIDDYAKLDGKGNIVTASFIDVADEATENYLYEIYNYPEIWESRI